MYSLFNLTKNPQVLGPEAVLAICLNHMWLASSCCLSGLADTFTSPYQSFALTFFLRARGGPLSMTTFQLDVELKLYQIP